MRRAWDRDRVKASLAAAAFHAVAGYALLFGLGFDVPGNPQRTLKVFSIAPDPPPPAPVPPPAPPRAMVEKAEGTSAPAGLPPTPVVAPKPKVALPLPSPIVAVPVPAQGSGTQTGASNAPGAGSGTGGDGRGTGNGGSGSGSGQGTSARRIQGGLRYSDLPRAALRAQLRGTVYVRYTAQPDGSARNCLVTRSSGYAELDQTTCGLIERRFHYSPARDRDGRAIPEVITTSFDWEPYGRN